MRSSIDRVYTESPRRRIPMKDCQNQEIEMGDVVVVAHRKGSSQWLTETRVVDYACPNPVLERKSKKGFIRYEYRGSQRAIMVIAKGTGSNVSTPVKPILEGDEDTGTKVNPYDPVPGVRW